MLVKYDNIFFHRAFLRTYIFHRLKRCRKTYLYHRRTSIKRRLKNSYLFFFVSFSFPHFFASQIAAGGSEGGGRGKKKRKKKHRRSASKTSAGFSNNVTFCFLLPISHQPPYLAKTRIEIKNKFMGLQPFFHLLNLCKLISILSIFFYLKIFWCMFTKSEI